MARKYKRKKWSQGELDTFVSLWHTESMEFLAENFGVSKGAIASLAARFRKMGLSLSKKNDRPTPMQEVVKKYKPN